jgi:hypothetical protein
VSNLVNNEYEDKAMYCSPKGRPTRRWWRIANAAVFVGVGATMYLIIDDGFANPQSPQLKRYMAK